MYIYIYVYIYVYIYIYIYIHISMLVNAKTNKILKCIKTLFTVKA